MTVLTFLSRRSVIQGALTLLSTSLAARNRTSTALGNRAHISARPAAREPLTRCLVELFGCPPPAALPAPTLSQPILAFRFPSGGSISVEFRDDAPDEREAAQGAWLEIHATDAAEMQRRVREAGLRIVRHLATPTFYVALPGGQVVSIVSAPRA